MAFVATAAPQGWKLGRWSEVNKTTWQEEKLDNPQIVYQFQVVSGPSLPGSNTVRLKMKDQNTEVLLLAASAQVFVNGSYFGEYAGEWQNASKGRASVAKRGSEAAIAPVSSKEQPRGSVSKEQSAPAPEKAAPVEQKRASKQGPAFEQTLTPEQATPQKSAPKKAPPPASAPSPASVNSYPQRSEFEPWQAPEASRKGKAPGLDKSDASMQKLIGAAKNGDVSQVKQLLESGIDPDGPGKDGQTPLMAATKGGHTAVVEALLEACADPTLGKGEETPLTIAFQKGNQNLLKVLFAGSFNNLNSMVGPGSIDLPTGSQRAQFDPESLESDLRDITRKIADINRDKPPSPSGKYGNYSHLTSGALPGEDEDEMMRIETVRMTMKSLAKTGNAAGLGAPASPKK